MWKSNWLALGTFAVLAMGLLYGLTSREPLPVHQPPPPRVVPNSLVTPTPSSASSTAYKVATLDHGGPGASDAAVLEIDRLFDRLESKCPERRDPKGQQAGLGDMAYASVEMLRNGGKQMRMVDFLRAMDDSIPSDGVKALELSCAEVASSLVVMMGGRSK